MRSSLSNRPRDHRGIPIPWFVTEKKPDGTWDFVRIHPDQMRKAYRENHCWICGDPLRILRSFVCGPLSVATGSVAEPPAHLDCARFAVRVCPFMTNPRYERTFKGENPGLKLDRNPKVSCIFTTDSWSVTFTPQGIIYRVVYPKKLEAYREGRPATVEEYRESLYEGFTMALEKPEIKAQPQFFEAFAKDVERASAIPLTTPSIQGIL